MNTAAASESMTGTPKSWQWLSIAREQDIERQWAEQRQILTQAAPAGEGSGAESHAARALTANLIVYAEDAADAEALANVTAELGRRHPARVFLVVPATSGLELRLAVQAHGSDIVEIRSESGPAASIVGTLLQEDLPTLLWWHGPSLGKEDGFIPEFRPWTALPDRILVDGRRWQARPDELARWARALAPTVQLSDMTWTRVTPWRQLLCQGLETDPAGPTNIVAVRLASGSKSSSSGGTAPSLAATLLVGWLAHLLDWRPDARLGPQGLRCRPAGGGPQVVLQFDTVAGGNRPGRLHEMHVKATPPQVPPLDIAIAHRPDHLSLDVHRDGHVLGRWAGPAAADLRSDTDALCEELSLHGSDPLYLSALERGCAILEQLELPA